MPVRPLHHALFRPRILADVLFGGLGRSTKRARGAIARPVLAHASDMPG